MSQRDSDEFFWQGGVDLSKLSEELSSRRPRLAAKKSWEPLIDLIEEEGRIVLKADISGVRGEDIELTYVPERHAIILRGNRPEDQESEQEKVGVFQLEILYGEFEREVALPNIALNVSDIRALYKNGLLIVLIPKQDEASKKVVIRTE